MEKYGVLQDQDAVAKGICPNCKKGPPATDMRSGVLFCSHCGARSGNAKPPQTRSSCGEGKSEETDQ